MQTAAAAAAADEDDADVSVAAVCSHQPMLSLHYTHKHTAVQVHATHQSPSHLHNCTMPKGSIWETGIWVPLSETGD